MPTLMKPAIEKKPNSFLLALKGERSLASVYWPWVLCFSFVYYFIYSIRQVIASTPSGAITGMIVIGFYILALPIWFFCVWRCAPNTERDAWMYLSRTSLILIAYYAYGRLMFLKMIISS